MRFCPSCEVRLKKRDSGLECPQCGHVEGEEAGKAAKNAAAREGRGEVSEFNVFDKDDVDETLPTIKIGCEKCGHGEAVWWMLQTRSADEATTQFYRCVKCGYTWRNYD